MKTLFFTFSRSDYTSLKPILSAVADDPFFELKLVAGGSHLVAEFGNSVSDIIGDGHIIWREINFLNPGKSTADEIGTAYSKLVDACVTAIRDAQPEAVFILGDRWEMLAVATAASVMHVPIIHHSGGDLTQGSMDNQTRHAISQLSHVHLVALPDHAKRLRLFGEEEWRIAVTGEPALTGIRDGTANASLFYDAVPIDSEAPFALASFHPTSFDHCPHSEQIDYFIWCITNAKMNVILTGSNPDHGFVAFHKRLIAASKSLDHIFFTPNLGGTLYYQALASASLMIGNSSSGLWEAPSFKLPVINIGRRQEGRTAGANVINIAYNQSEFLDALALINTDDYKANLAKTDNPYYRDDCLERCLTAMKACLSAPKLREKIFNDHIGLLTTCDEQDA